MSVFARIVLWLWVISAGILLGGALYEGRVILPLWAGAPPESVMAWPYGTVQVSFFGVATPVYAVLSLGMLVASLWMSGRMRTFALVAGASGVVIGVWTFLFFVPILQQTQATRGAGLGPDEITRLTNQFVNWNYLRYAVLVTGWLAGLKALSVSGPPERMS